MKTINWTQKAMSNFQKSATYLAISMISMTAVVGCSNGGGGGSTPAPAVAVSTICAPNVPCTGVNGSVPIAAADGKSGAGFEELTLQFYSSTTGTGTGMNNYSGQLYATGFITLAQPSVTCGYGATGATPIPVVTSQPGQIVGGGLSFANLVLSAPTLGLTIYVGPQALNGAYLTPSPGATSASGVAVQYRLGGYIVVQGPQATSFCSQLPIYLN